MKKKALSLFIAVMLLSLLSVLAINLEVSSKAVSNSFLIESKEPAIFDLTIKNLGEADKFEIYSLVGVNITYTPFTLDQEETKKVRIYLTPHEYLLTKPQSYIFEYKLSDSKNKLQSESLTINIVNLESSFSIKSDPISPKAERIILDIKNNVMKEFSNVEFKISSKFFTHEETLSFAPNDKKFVEILIDKDKLKKLDAGNYILNTQIKLNNNIANIESQIKFLETEGIETIEEKEGTIIIRSETIKKNTGNVKKIVKKIYNS